MNGEAFLHKKDTNLQKSESVTKAVEKQDRLNRIAREEILETNTDRDSSEIGAELENFKKTPNTPEARVGVYLKRLEKIFLDQSVLFSNTEQEQSKAKRNLELLKPYIYDEFILKEEALPDRYFELQRQIAREQGRDYPETISDKQRHEAFEKITQDQRESLNRWLDYLTGPDALYPPWFKFFAMKSILGLSEFDKKEHKFPKRTNSTTGLFPDLNSEALAYVCEFLEKQIQKIPIENPIPEPDNPYAQEQKPVSDTEFEAIISSENFAKYYAFTLEHMTSQKELWPETRGEWRTFSKGEDSDLVKSLQGKGTGWCTAGAGMASSQLSMGQFHVYYSLDKLGQPTIPRLAIRMVNDEIREVRGVDKDQNTDPFILPVLEEKLPEFGTRGGEYLKKAADVERLTDIDNRVKQGQQLSQLDLRFLYEVDGEISSFRQHGKDPRVKELLTNRNWLEDMQQIFSVSDQESLLKQLISNGNTAFLFNNIDKFSNIPKKDALTLISIDASRVIYNWDNFEDLDNIEVVMAFIKAKKSHLLIFNIEKFESVSQKDIYDLILKHDEASLIARNIKHFSELDQKQIAIDLVKHGAIDSVLDEYQRFNTELDDQYFAEYAIGTSSLSTLANNLNKFKKLEGVAIADKLISGGFGNAVAENIDIFVDIDKQDVTERLIEKRQISGILKNLDNYSDIRIDMDLVGEIYLEQLLENTITPTYVKEFPLEFQHKCADTLMQAGKVRQVTDSIECFDDSLHKEISLQVSRIIEEESKQNERRNLDYLGIFGKHTKFKQIDSSVAFKILNLNSSQSVLTNLTKYPDLNHQEVADIIGPAKLWGLLRNTHVAKLNQKTFELLLVTPADDSEGRDVNFHYLFQCIDSFIITDYSAIAEKLISLKEHQELANNLDKLKDLPLAVANNLLPDYGHKIIKNFDAFLPSDKRAIAERLLEEDYTAAVAKHLSELKGINHQLVVQAIIEKGLGIEIVKNFHNYSELELDHQKIVDTFIATGQQKRVVSILTSLKDVNQETLKRAGISDEDIEWYIKRNQSNSE